MGCFFFGGGALTLPQTNIIHWKGTFESMIFRNSKGGEPMSVFPEGRFP